MGEAAYLIVTGDPKFHKNLLFEFNKQTNIAIHSYFVFFDFLAIWLDDKNKVIEWKIIKPFNSLTRPNKSFFKLVEVPINKNNEKILQFFVGRGKV